MPSSHLHSVTPIAIALSMACGSVPKSMIHYADVRSSRQAEFFADGDTLVMRASNPMGANLVPYDPRLEQGQVILEVGIASGGAAGTRTYCFRLGRLSPPENWSEHVFWREPDGTLVHVTGIGYGEMARELAAKCPTTTAWSLAR